MGRQRDCRRCLGHSIASRSLRSVTPVRAFTPTAAASICNVHQGPAGHGTGGRGDPPGLRSAFKVWCAEVAQVRDEVSEAALAHTIPDKVRAAYLRTDFLDEREALMASCLGFHTEWVSEPAEVIPALRRALDVNKSDRPAYIEFILSSSAASTPSTASGLDAARSKTRCRS